MATCKDCLHADVCYYKAFNDVRPDVKRRNDVEVLCKTFTDKSRFVELPCKIGDVVYSLYHWWRKEDGIVPYQITNLTITQNKKGSKNGSGRLFYRPENKKRAGAFAKTEKDGEVT